MLMNMSCFKIFKPISRIGFLYHRFAPRRVRKVLTLIPVSSFLATYLTGNISVYFLEVVRKRLRIIPLIKQPHTQQPSCTSVAIDEWVDIKEFLDD